MRKKKAFALGLVCLTLCLGGCWDQHPVETRAAVSAIGIDPGSRRGTEDYTFTFPNVTATAGSLATTPQSQEFYTVHVTGRNLIQALLAAQREESRTLYLGQVRVLCLSTRLAPQTWRSILNTMADSGRFVLTTWVVGAQHAGAVAALAPPTEVVPEVAVYNAMVCRCQAFRWPGRAWRLWDADATSGISPAVVMIAAKGERFRLTQLAVMGSNRMVAWPAQATAGWAYLTGRVLKDSINIEMQHVPLVVGLIRGSRRWQFSRHGRQVVMHVTLNYSGVVLGTTTPSDSIARDQEVENAAAKAILKRVAAAWQEAKETHTDPMGWHRAELWEHSKDEGGPLSWRGWSVVTTVHFHLREEGVLQ